MGKITDFTIEKVKQGGRSLGRYAGAPLIKGFWDMGASVYTETYKIATKKPDADLDIDDTEAAKDIEKWLQNKGNVKSKYYYASSGEKYLREREKEGLNLMEIDKHYTNASALCLFFTFLILYCFGSGIYHIINGGGFWIVTYFTTGVVFVLMYLYFALDAACILNRRHIDGKHFLKTPSMWIPRFVLPDDWKVED